MTDPSVAEILIVWGTVQGYKNLVAMLEGKETIKEYLEQLIQGASKDLEEAQKRLDLTKAEEMPKDNEAKRLHRMRIKMLKHEVSRYQRYIRFASSHIKKHTPK